MNASDVVRFWQELVPEGWEATCDRLHYGAPDRPVRKAAVCFKLTLANLDEALAWGADIIIPHEPLYPRYDGRMAADETDPVIRAMHDRLEQSGVALFRLHDHAHLHTDDFIHRGFLRKLDLAVKPEVEIIRLGFRQYELLQPMTVRELAALTAQRLNTRPRLAGSIDTPVTKMILALGGIGDLGYEVLSRADAQLLITGELNELGCAFYANEAAALGMNKAFMVLGHCESEWAGMEYLADRFGQQCPELEVRYFGSGSTYHEQDI